MVVEADVSIRIVTWVHRVTPSSVYVMERKMVSRRRSSVRSLNVKQMQSLVGYVPSTNLNVSQVCVKGKGQECMDFV